MTKRADFIEELSWRGLLYQHTEGAREAIAAGNVAGYAGFDPTASSLHVGSMVPIMGLVHLQRAGHRPVVLVGGGTGLIGDPSGKSAERSLLGAEEIGANSAAIKSQLERFFDLSGPNAPLFADNSVWLPELDLFAFLRDVGKHFTVNYMLAKESVRARIETGISFTEFSYMLLQAYDFLELSRRHGVTLQLGGSDQWGNITAGIELIRRMDGREAHGVTLPLIATASGEKFGKTEAGTIWLDAARTSPYQFYQFWINTPDAEAGSYLRCFTLMDRPEIETLERQLREHPERRAAQWALATDITTRVHGAPAAKVAEEVSGVLFGDREPRDLSLPVIQALAREIPFAPISRSAAKSILDLVVGSGLAPSNGAARRLIQQGGVYANGARIEEGVDTRSIATLPGEHILLRKGARQFALVRLGD